MKTYLIIAAVSLVMNCVTLGVGLYKGYHWGAADKQADWDKAIAAATTGKIDIKVKQDEIENSPIDSNVTNRRLHNGTF